MTVEELNVIVSANANNFTQQMAQVQSRLGRFGTEAESASATALSAFKSLASGIAALGIGSIIKDSLMSAGELEQNLGGTEVVFKQYADVMQNTAKTAALAMGLSQSEYLAAANKMGAFLQSSGYGVAKSAEVTIEVMQRAADVASVMGIDISSAMQAVTGAAKGNFTMMDNLGVAITDTTLQIYAQEKGLGKLETTQQKVIAAMQLFLEKTEYADGNYVRENETLIGSLTTLKAELSNLAAEAGTAMLPLATSVIPLISGAVEAAKPAIADLAGGIGSLGSVVTDFAAKLENATPAQKTMLKIALGMAVAIPAVTAATKLMTAAKLGYTAALNLLIPKQLTFGAALKASLGWIGLIAGALALFGMFSNESAEATDNSGKALAKEEAAMKSVEGAVKSVGKVIGKTAESTDNLTDSVNRSLAGFDELNRLGTSSGSAVSAIVTDADVDTVNTYTDALSDVQSAFSGLDGTTVSVDFDSSGFMTAWDGIEKAVADGKLGEKVAEAFSKAESVMKPFYKTADNLLGTHLSGWLGEVGEFVGDISDAILTGDTNKAVDAVLDIIADSVYAGGPAITTAVGWIIETVDDMLGSHWKECYDSTVKFCEDIGKALYNTFNDVDGYAERSNRYANTYQEMIDYAKEYMKSNGSDTTAAYFATLEHFKVDADENPELVQWYTENDIDESLHNFIFDIAKILHEIPTTSHFSSSDEMISESTNFGRDYIKKVRGYSSGGFPDYGSLFIANESGPELVGTLGGRTAVVNNAQIENALYNAVYSAFSNANAGSTGGDIRVYVELDGEVVAEAVARQNEIRNKRFNGR